MNRPDNYELAKLLVSLGISVIPIRTDSPKAPALGKTDPVLNRKRLASEQELAFWFRSRRQGVAALGGPISGNLECLDFDEPGIVDQWKETVERLAPGLISKLVFVRTPKGGAHAWYRCEAVGPNAVLSRRQPTKAELAEQPKEKFKKLIETRGNGGYALLPGSPPECHECNKEYEYEGDADISDVQTITPEEREILFDVARSFNSYVELPKSPPKPRSTAEGLQPGDDFDRRGDWQEILEPHGWKLDSGEWNCGKLTRPGKDRGLSATVGICRGSQEEPLLYVFSTSTDFEANKAYGRFRAYAILNHRADLSAAAKELASKGYGAPARKTTSAGESAGESDRGGQEAGPDKKPAENPFLKALTWEEFDSLDQVDEWLIDNVMIANEPMILAGPSKTLKTSIAIDAAVSIACGRPFLGKYRIPNPKRVFVLSAESGAMTLKKLARRVAEAKNVNPKEASERLRWFTQVESLVTATGRLNLTEALKAFECSVVVLDPAYLLLGGEVTTEKAGNFFAMGELLARIGDACLKVGAVPVILTHSNGKIQTGSVMELQHIGWSGFQQWARQWWLLNRRSEYEDDGRHELYFRFGGSAGHTGLLELDVEEGTLEEGRKWQVEVRTGAEARRNKNDEKAAMEEAAILENSGRVLEAMLQILKEEGNQVATENALKKRIGLTTKPLQDAIRKLVSDGRVEWAQGNVQGRGKNEQFSGIRTPKGWC